MIVSLPEQIPEPSWPAPKSSGWHLPLQAFWNQLRTTTNALLDAVPGLVPATRTVNDKALTGNIELSAADVGARAGDWVPTLDQLTDVASALVTKLAVGMARPVIRATAADTWPSRASSIPAGYAGPVEFDSSAFPGSAGPSDMVAGDWWTSRP